MIDSTAEFFQELGRRGHEPLLEKATGIVRFDLVSVSRKNAGADCIVRAERTLFDAMATGDVNGMAAYLRGELTLEGDPELLVLVQRVFPGPATRRSRRRRTGRGRDPR